MIFMSNLMLLTLSLTQALGLWFLHHAISTDAWPAQDLGLLISSYLVILAAPLTLVLLWTHRAQRVLWTVVAGLVFFLMWSGSLRFGSLAVPASQPVDEDLIAQNIAPYVIALLLGLPLLRARLETGRWLAPYTAVFQAVWRSALTLAESLIFTGMFWALLLLWAELFSLLGIDFFSDIFSDPRFIYPASTLAFTTAIRIVAASERLLDGVLEQLLDVLKWLAPMAGFIVILFTLFLLPRVVDLFDRGERILDSSVLIALVGANVLLLNAGYRDGTRDPGYGRWLREAFRIVPPLLFIVSLTALASLVIRVQALGLTPPRAWGMVAALFSVGISAGYSWSAVTSTPWLEPLQRVNFISAVVLLFMLTVSLTPLGNPLRWSIENQQGRALLASSPELRDSALRFLRFDAGEPGRRALTRLQSEPRVRADALRVAAMTRDIRPLERDPQATSARYQRWRASLQGAEVPATLEPQLQLQFLRSAAALDPGGDGPAPQLLRVDLNRDGSDDYLLITGRLRGKEFPERDYRIFVTAEAGATWQLASAGVLRGFHADHGGAIVDAQTIRTMLPRWQDLEVDGQRLSLRPSEP